MVVSDWCVCVYMVREGVCAETSWRGVELVADGMSRAHFLMPHTRHIVEHGSALIAAALPNPQYLTHSTTSSAPRQ